ncbi:unnamed protein product [Dibothriocephalus latus]|uniref:Major facilitator superfamily (MFS) profile domain-containing protein n=1 Tax=Dibothriocephalus latus TaxID=60516 RepID=A0A3P7M1S3_DIBLA|nr:unnamed protein product [Dibothriocephalus latus]
MIFCSQGLSPPSEPTNGLITLLILGRILTGVAAGMLLATASVFLVEVAPPSQRGQIGSFAQFGIVAGICLAYAFGMYKTWFETAKLMLFPTAVLFVLCFYLPESPVWLSRNGNLKLAVANLSWLRGDVSFERHNFIFKTPVRVRHLVYFLAVLLTVRKCNLILAFIHIGAILLNLPMLSVSLSIWNIFQLFGFFQHLIALDELSASSATKDSDADDGQLSLVSLLLPCKAVLPQLRPRLRMAINLMIFQQLTGVNVITFYTEPLCQKFVPISQSARCAFSLGLAQLVFSLIACMFIDRFPRRVLLLSTGLIMSSSLILFAFGQQVSPLYFDF